MRGDRNPGDARGVDAGGPGRATALPPDEFDPAHPERLFPGELQADVDAAVEGAHAGRTESPAAARLAAALGARDDESGPWSFPDLFDLFFADFVIDLSRVSGPLNDDTLREHWEDQVGEDGEITDALRADYIRSMIESGRSNAIDEDVSPAVIAVPLRASDGRSAVLVATGAQLENVGFSVDWWGAHRDVDAAQAALEAAGLYRRERWLALPDEALLAYWER